MALLSLGLSPVCILTFLWLKLWKYDCYFLGIFSYSVFELHITFFSPLRNRKVHHVPAFTIPLFIFTFYPSWSYWVSLHISARTYLTFSFSFSPLNLYYNHHRHCHRNLISRTRKKAAHNTFPRSRSIPTHGAPYSHLALIPQLPPGLFFSLSFQLIRRNPCTTQRPATPEHDTNANTSASPHQL